MVFSTLIKLYITLTCDQRTVTLVYKKKRKRNSFNPMKFCSKINNSSSYLILANQSALRSKGTWVYKLEKHLIEKIALDVHYP